MTKFMFLSFLLANVYLPALRESLEDTFISTLLPFMIGQIAYQ